MRGDLTVFVSDITRNLAGAHRFVVDGNTISGTDGAGVGNRSSERSFRVSLSAASVAAIGVEGPIRLEMTAGRNDRGGRIYKIVAAKGKPAHGKLTTRA